MKTRVRSMHLFLLAALLFLSACATPQPTPTSTAVPSPIRPPAPTATPTPETAMFRGDSAHTGVYPAQPGASEWVFAVGSHVDSSPAVGDGLVLFGREDGRLLAVDVRSGKEVWSLDAGAQLVSSPAIVAGVAYFASMAGILYAVDIQTGDEVWSFTAQAPIMCSPAVAGGAVYANSLDATFYAVDAETGQERWQVATGTPTQSSPAVYGNTVYLGVGDGLLYAFDFETGAEKWRFQTGDQIIATPAISGDTLYLAGMDGNLYALDPESGELRWTFETQIPIGSSPAVVEDVLYFATAEGTLRALDIEGQTEIWQFPTSDTIISSPAVADGTVYVGSLDGRFYAVDAATGQERWRFQTEGEIYSSPAVAGDMVYFGSYDGRFYALNRKAPTLASLAPTPTPRPMQPTPTLMPPPAESVETATGGLPWWNDRVFYEVFVRSFYDSDGNGIGDLQGLIDKLDYLNDGDPTTDTDLGVTGIWLMPVAQSPSYHGYDVVDYKTIEEDYGTNEDFERLMAEAHERGIVVITDLVLNHTSSQHPWFLDSETPGSEHETWYIWTTERPTYSGPWGQQVWYKVGLRWYYALFWEGMPDLNYRNGAVTEAMLDVTRFWLEEMGVDGFRLDAIRHLIEDGPVQENTPETHEWVKGFNRYVHALNPDALIIGEVWDDTAEIVKYVGGQLDVAFEFDLAQAILDSVWRGDNSALLAAQESILAHYPEGQYAPFLTNHDQNRVMNALRNDVASAKVAAALLLTNPGVPFIYYGEEIGMRGAKPDERIRTPMQWDSSETAGFTTGEPWEALAGDLETVNVATQDADPDSLLNQYRALIRLREAHPALRAGDAALVTSTSQKVYAMLRHGEGETLLIVANLSDEPVSEYSLALESGPLAGALGAEVLFGQGEAVALQVNADGGFDAYVPLPVLEPKSVLVIALR